MRSFWGIIYTYIYINKHLWLASARENEIDRVSFLQRPLCIIPFVLSLIFRLFQRGKLGVPCGAAEQGSHRVAGILGKGMSLESGGRRVFQSGLALLQSVLNFTMTWVCVWMKKPDSHFCWVRFPGHREKTTFFLQRGRQMTVQEDPSRRGGPDH